jgi:exopolysaccharide biosynthesis polyprenyl glycosylphosphotransferase
MLRRDRKTLIVLAQIKDSLLFGAALWLAHVVRTLLDTQGLVEPFEAFTPLYVVLLPGVPLILDLHGFYSRPLIARRRDTAWRLLKACIITTMILVSASFLMKESPARGVFVLFAVVSFVLVFASEEILRAYLRSKIKSAQFRQRYVLIGAPEDTTEMLAKIRNHADEGIDIVAELDLNNYSVERVTQLVHEHSAAGVIINTRHTYFGEIEKAIHACELEGLEVWLMADFFKPKISRTSYDEFQGRPMLVFQSAPEESMQIAMKRLVDIIGAATLLIFGSPFLLVFALLVKRGSPGPVLFRQARCGLRGKPFIMLKFRTMVTNAEQRQHELAAMNEMSGPVFKVTNDPRVTPIGRFLRKYSIDEWPQLVNVLRGEMSLVGPRPLPVEEVRRFDDMAHRRRLSVKPGLTCLWQISGRNDVRDFRDWVRLDLEYIDNWSLWLDIKILIRTIPVVIVGTGAK